jgi:hypothetical protein
VKECHDARVVVNLVDMTGQNSSSSRVLTVASATAAQVLLRPHERRFLEPFVGRELGAAEAARELGLPVEQLAYRVRALCKQGLLEVKGTRPRKGRAITLYTAAAEIQAPLDMLPYEDVRGFFHLVDSGLRELFMSNLARLADRSGLGDWVVRLYRGSDGGIRLDLAPSGGAWDPAVLLSDKAPAVVFNWVPLTLSTQQAKALQRDLLALIGRYHDPTGVPTHLLGLFLTPARL